VKIHSPFHHKQGVENTMVKKSARSKASGTAAIAVPAGKKIVFGEEDTIDGDLDVHPDQSFSEGDANSQEDDGEYQSDSQNDSDDNEAPEAVGFAVDRRKAKAEEDVEAAYVQPHLPKHTR
jgi:hypothetical protein